MNEIHGLAPNAPSTLAELRAHLASFGPQTSRYLLVLPSYKLWCDALLNHFSYLGDMDIARLKSVILRANTENSVFIERRLDYWPISETWLRNALWHWKNAQPRYKPILVSEQQYEQAVREGSSEAVYLTSPLELPPISPADEEIDTEPEDYWRVSKWICSISAEVHLIDPYMDPTAARDVRDIFLNFVDQLSKLRKPTYLHFWVRNSRYKSEAELKKANAELRQLILEVTKGLNRNFQVSFHWVEDSTSSDKLHARYLLTEKGGIKFDQGFQRVRPKGKRNMVSPVGLTLHKQLFEKFSMQKNDFKVLETIRVGT